MVTLATSSDTEHGINCARTHATLPIVAIACEGTNIEWYVAAESSHAFLRHLCQCAAPVLNSCGGMLNIGTMLLLGNGCIRWWRIALQSAVLALTPPGCTWSPVDMTGVSCQSLARPHNSIWTGPRLPKPETSCTTTKQLLTQYHSCYLGRLDRSILLARGVSVQTVGLSNLARGGRHRVHAFHTEYLILSATKQV